MLGYQQLDLLEQFGAHQPAEPTLVSFPSVRGSRNLEPACIRLLMQGLGRDGQALRLLPEYRAGDPTELHSALEHSGLRPVRGGLGSKAFEVERLVSSAGGEEHAFPRHGIDCLYDSGHGTATKVRPFGSIRSAWSRMPKSFRGSGPARLSVKRNLGTSASLGQAVGPPTDPGA